MVGSPLPGRAAGVGGAAGEVWVVWGRAELPSPANFCGQCGAQSVTVPARRSGARRNVLAAVAVAAVAAGIAVTVLVVASRGSNDPADEPAEESAVAATPGTVIDEAELPAVDPAVAEDTLTYLEGDGAALVRLVVVAEGADGLFERSACAAAKEELAVAGSPAELADLAIGVADEVTRSSLEGTRTAVVAVLASCQAGETDDTAADRAADSAALYRQRIDQLEMA